MDTVFAYTTFKDTKEAEEICKLLVQEKLIACANIMPAHKAIYEWQGKLETSSETAAFLKTKKILISKLSERIKALHSYDVPCLVTMNISGGNPEFINWINKQTL